MSRGGPLVERIGRLIKRYPTFGYCKLWAMLRFKQGVKVNRKAVYRVLSLKGWFVHQRQPKARPRVRSSRSVAARSNRKLPRQGDSSKVEFLAD